VVPEVALSAHDPTQGSAALRSTPCVQQRKAHPSAHKRHRNGLKAEKHCAPRQQAVFRIVQVNLVQRLRLPRDLELHPCCSCKRTISMHARTDRPPSHHSFVPNQLEPAECRLKDIHEKCTLREVGEISGVLRKLEPCPPDKQQCLHFQNRDTFWKITITLTKLSLPT
jgi:hypothetical protein